MFPKIFAIKKRAERPLGAGSAVSTGVQYSSRPSEFFSKILPLKPMAKFKYN